MHTWELSGVIALSVLAPLGCSSNNSNVPDADAVPVTGTVTLDNKPLAHATVYFTPENDAMGKSSTAITDANGKYELVTSYGKETKKGAVPGKYRVWFSLLVGPDGKPVTVDSDTSPYRCQLPISRVAARDGRPNL